MRLMPYNYTAQWLKGSKNDAPDALSRHPLHDPEVTDALAELDTNDDPEMSLTEIRAVAMKAYAYKKHANMPNKMSNISYCRTSY